MKNLAIGLFVIGLTTLGFSQEKYSVIDGIKLRDVIISQTSDNEVLKTNINYSYLEKVQDISTSEQVKELESVASRFNVMELPQFDGRNESFKTLFRGTKGYIIATYDRNGKILTTKEHYNDVKLPKPMIKSVLSQFPDCNFLKVVYNVSYKDQKDVKKIYRVQIMNNNATKNLKLVSEGNNDNAIVMTLEN